MILLASSASAHDFWVEPQRFQTQAGFPLAFTFQVGHGTDRQRWGNGADRIVLLQAISKRQRTDLRSAVRPTSSKDFVARLNTPGLHIIAMQSTAAFSELPALRFNDYAKTEGLAPILASRRRENRTGAPGRELYSRRTKTLVLVGAANATDQGLATRPIGLKLEIVPERNPYTLGAARRLPVRVLYQGRKLANATVKFTDLDHDSKPLAVAITDREGRAAFNIPAKGRYMFNVVWSEPLKRDRRADFDTTFSSLTFGYDR